MNTTAHKHTVSALTHLAWDGDNKPYIGQPLTKLPLAMPVGYFTGYFGLQTEKKVSPFLYKTSLSLYGKELCRVTVLIDDHGIIGAKQDIDTVAEIEVLDLFNCKASLVSALMDYLEIFPRQEKTLFSGDNKLLRHITKHPEMIGRLFNKPELLGIKAIIWPSNDPDNFPAYLKMITIRSLDLIAGYKIHNYDGDRSLIEFAKI